MIVYNSISELATALKQAEEAHHKLEQLTGKTDVDWPTFYAKNMAENNGGVVEGHPASAADFLFRPI
jgi:hypothetical protein